MSLPLYIPTYAQSMWIHRIIQLLPQILRFPTSFEVFRFHMFCEMLTLITIPPFFYSLVGYFGSRMLAKSQKVRLNLSPFVTGSSATILS